MQQYFTFQNLTVGLLICNLLTTLILIWIITRKSIPASKDNMDRYVTFGDLERFNQNILFISGQLDKLSGNGHKPVEEVKEPIAAKETKAGKKRSANSTKKKTEKTNAE